MHHGYYPKGAAPKSNQEAQIDMIEEVLKWAGATKATKVRESFNGAITFENTLTTSQSDISKLVHNTYPDTAPRAPTAVSHHHMCCCGMPKSFLRYARGPRPAHCMPFCARHAYLYQYVFESLYGQALPDMRA